MSFDPASAMDDLVALVEREAPGWSIACKGRGHEDSIRLHLTHPLAHDGVHLDCNPVDDKQALLSRVQDSLRRLPMYRVLSAAEDVEHVALLRDLREMADGGRLHSWVRRGFADVLRKHGILTEAEADWFGNVSSGYVEVP